MSKFNCSYERTEMQNKILDLELNYMNKLEKIFTSDLFIRDLKRIEIETQKKYDLLTEIWGKKNKIKEASERLVRHHIYKNFNGSFYSSPISCDIALELDDIILNVDIKTIDKIGNKGELDTTQFEHNQTSFINKNVLSVGSFAGFKVKSNLESIDIINKKPVLTYLIKIGYVDDNNGYFQLINDDYYPSLVLTCLPNGQLSNLFDNDLFLNFKDYAYYSASDGFQYQPRKICGYNEYKTLSLNDKYKIIENKTDIPRKWEKLEINSKIAYYDKDQSTLRITVKRTEKKLNIVYLEAVKTGNTARFNDEWLKERYDSSNSYWRGVRKFYHIYK